MSKSSMQLNIALPWEVVEKYKECQNLKNISNFARLAFIEKLNTFPGINIPLENGDFSKGRRSDLAGEKKAKKLPSLRKQAARARASKKAK